MEKRMEKRFDHKAEEKELYERWERSGYFSPERCIEDGICQADAEPFSIVLPPPNVTGELHMGHAVMLVLEDIMVRYNRMRGQKTLWVPGTDHAAIATQTKVENQLYKEKGKTRHDLGREAFLKLVDDYATESHDTIVNQIRRIGASVDWGREAFTLDEERSCAVRTAFKRMYEDGLVFKGERIVNWDPKLQTTVSDDEIEWVEETIPFFYFQYGPFVIGTARPETKFGDKYVVVHPDDKRYGDYKHGQKMDVEWINGTVTATVIKDEVIDPEFGSGAMTITPWHDQTDFELAERHSLEREQIINPDGELMPVAGEFAGMPIEEARQKVVEKLEKKGLLVKVDKNYVHRIATNSRGGGKIEPQIMDQWFVDVNKKFKVRGSNIKGIKEGQMATLKDLMRTVVENGQVKIIPKRFEKVYYHWIDNLRNWCISRQIWYGHRIPVWYKNSEVYVGVDEPDGDGWEQDPDTLDTWFSSGLWTFSTLGWPLNYAQGKPVLGSDLDLYHPTSVLETGYDILFFWVARMILMTTYLLGEIPFETVYLHGLIRDIQGRKMSKSLGNGIDPLEMVEEYGADATRLSLVIGAGPGNDTRLSEDKVRAYRNFGTKIWNVARFLLMNKPEGYRPQDDRFVAGDLEKYESLLTDSDRKRIEEFEAVKSEVTAHYDAFELHLAGEKAYNYFWNVFANEILEGMKERLRNENANDARAAYYVLERILRGCLKLLHPFMPFVTEAVWQLIAAEDEAKKDTNLLMVADW